MRLLVVGSCLLPSFFGVRPTSPYGLRVLIDIRVSALAAFKAVAGLSVGEPIGAF